MSVYLTKNGQVMPFQSTDMIDYKMALNSGWTPTIQAAAMQYNAPVMQQYETAVQNAAPYVAQYQAQGNTWAPLTPVASTTKQLTGGTGEPLKLGDQWRYDYDRFGIGSDLVISPARIQTAFQRLDSGTSGNNLQYDMEIVDLAKKNGYKYEAPASITSPTPAPITPPTPTTQTESAEITTATGIDMTGWTDSEKALYGVYQEYANKMKAQGKVLNPSIVIDQALIDRFKSQARTEMEPYYSQLFKQADEDIAKAVEKAKETYGASVRDIGQTFGKGLESAQETYARRGLEFSSERQKAEQMLADEAKQKIADATKAAQESAYKAGTDAERALGTANMPTNIDWTIGTGQTPILGQAGVYGVSGSTGTRSLFSPVGGTTGTVERQRIVDLATRENALAENERLRLASLYA